jgi:hypothetical protein
MGNHPPRRRFFPMSCPIRTPQPGRASGARGDAPELVRAGALAGPASIGQASRRFIRYAPIRRGTTHQTVIAK